MKYRNQFLKYQLHCNTDGDAGGGGGTDEGGTDGAAGNDDSGNNTQNNEHAFANMWENDSNTDDGNTQTHEAER